MLRDQFGNPPPCLVLAIFYNYLTYSIIIYPIHSLERVKVNLWQPKESNLTLQTKIVIVAFKRPYKAYIVPCSIEVSR